MAAGAVARRSAGTACRRSTSPLSVLSIHILADGLSIVLGATALMVRKGGSLHRRVGLASVASMAVMGISASIFALLKNPLDANVPGGVPFPMFFFLATVLLLAAFGDLRQLRADGVRGVARLRRHLWRMYFALFIAAGSFFSIRERVASILPDPFPSAPLRVLAILLPFAAMFYWFWRVRHRGPVSGAQFHSR